MNFLVYNLVFVNFRFVEVGNIAPLVCEIKYQSIKNAILFPTSNEVMRLAGHLFVHVDGHEVAFDAPLVVREPLIARKALRVQLAAAIGPLDHDLFEVPGGSEATVVMADPIMPRNRSVSSFYSNRRPPSLVYI